MKPKSMTVWSEEAMNGNDKSHFQNLLQWTLGWRPLHWDDYAAYLQEFEEVYGDKVLDRVHVFALLRRAEFVPAYGNLVRTANQARLQLPPWAEDFVYSEQTADDRVEHLREDVEERCYAVDDKSTFEVDDAISVKGDWFYVHVADVSYYIPYDNDINKLAQMRATTTYFADAVYSMFPRSVVDACTLKAAPGLCNMLSVGFRLSEDGRVTESRIFPARTRNCRRLTYEQANGLVIKAGRGEDMPAGLRAAAEAEAPPEWAGDDDAAVFGRLYEVAKKRKQVRLGDGALVIHNPEWRVVMDEKKEKVADVSLNAHQWAFDARKIIEEFMLLAGHSVAERCRREGIQAPYRVTYPPDSADIPGDTLRDFQYASKVESGTASMAGEAHSRLRGMKSAFYANEPLGHVALNSDYCHFTSPIRRYPDLLLHYQIKDSLVETAELEGEKLQPVVGATLPRLCDYLSNKTIGHRRMMMTSRQAHVLQRLAALTDPAMNGDPAKSFRCYVSETRHVAMNTLHDADRGEHVFCSTLVMLDFGVITQLYHSDDRLMPGALVDCRVAYIQPHMRLVRLTVVAVVEDEKADQRELASMAQALSANTI
eukprot:TRINITY_DN18931_c0_g1_i2.p1 TRINITY_DN18931_c0_g1~~TRINITY_DN18931_c0_g1_i2.p1  ORF type:complete len:596 (+),score=191.49 TRINITY_DN18931_c0_g1_i2:417-2204(+)